MSWPKSHKTSTLHSRVPSVDWFFMAYDLQKLWATQFKLRIPLSVTISARGCGPHSLNLESLFSVGRVCFCVGSQRWFPHVAPLLCNRGVERWVPTFPRSHNASPRFWGSKPVYFDTYSADFVASLQICTFKRARRTDPYESKYRRHPVSPMHETLNTGNAV